MLERVLGAEPLRLYQYYLSRLDRRESPENEIQVTDEIIRFLLSSRRIHNKLCPTSKRIDAWEGEFSIQQDAIGYFHRNSIILATLSLLHYENDPCFRIILNAHWEDQLDRVLLKFMFWAKRNSCNLLLDAQFRATLLSRVMHDLGYEYEDFDSLGDVNYIHYVQNLHEVLNKSKRTRNTVLIQGADFGRDEEDDWRGQPCRSVYLHGLFGHPKLTELILENCDGFVLCDYTPFPQMPNLRRIYSTMPLGSIGSTLSFQYYHDLLAEFEVKAPNCHLHFVNSSLTVEAASYEAHAGVLQQLATALQNMIQLATTFKNVCFQFNVHINLPEAAQSRRSEWLQVVGKLTPLCDIHFKENCWIYKPNLCVFDGEHTGLRLDLQYFFSNDVAQKLNGQVLRVFE